jgi:predicted metalloendopeptidase
MIEFIHKEFDRRLNNSEWMDEITKRNAYEKSRTIKFIVGYINEVMNDTLVNKSYEKVRFIFICFQFCRLFSFIFKDFE